MFKKTIYLSPSIRIFQQKNSLVFMNSKDSSYYISVGIPKNINISKTHMLLNISSKEGYKNSLYLAWCVFLKNLIKGLSRPFVVRLFLRGVGYKVTTQKNSIELKLGYSHNCFSKIKSFISVSSARNTIIDLRSPLKDSLGMQASIIQQYRRPDIYKNKGIVYKGEKIQIKAGKKA